MRILIATDGSPPADLAVDWAAGLRWADETTVRLIAVDDAYGEERASLETSLDAASEKSSLAPRRRRSWRRRRHVG